jgi:hypothetical protein
VFPVLLFNEIEGGHDYEGPCQGSKFFQFIDKARFTPTCNQLENVGLDPLLRKCDFKAHQGIEDTHYQHDDYSCDGFSSSNFDTDFILWNHQIPNFADFKAFKLAIEQTVNQSYHRNLRQEEEQPRNRLWTWVDQEVNQTRHC